MRSFENIQQAPPLTSVGCPLAYFITFSCYGCHLHGAEQGSVDRDHNLVGSRYVAPDAGRLRDAQARMRERPYLLDHASRQIVLAAIHQVCTHKGWGLIAAHVRMSHVHVVVYAEVTPERVLHAFKAYASRFLNQGTKLWTRHGSTRYLWTRESVDAAVRYVVEAQGEAMEAFLNTAP